ncbi:hypothetical protein [Sphaerimonospora mesophila]|uniref:hypothetical protein n=1 Tax=Sphaerimonospora mesophila TaxID=37483 RepID=UPI000A922B41
MSLRELLDAVSDGDDVPELTADHLLDMCQTLVCLQEAVAEVAVRESRRPQGLVRADGRLTRTGVDTALTVLGLPLVSDEEWWEIGG